VTLGTANEQALQAATVAPEEMPGWKEPRAADSCNADQLQLGAHVDFR
jgi:hypothetical protein